MKHEKMWNTEDVINVEAEIKAVDILPKLYDGIKATTLSEYKIYADERRRGYLQYLMRLFAAATYKDDTKAAEKLLEKLKKTECYFKKYPIPIDWK